MNKYTSLNSFYAKSINVFQFLFNIQRLNRNTLTLIKISFFVVSTYLCYQFISKNSFYHLYAGLLSIIAFVIAYLFKKKFMKKTMMTSALNNYNQFKTKYLQENYARFDKGEEPIKPNKPLFKSIYITIIHYGQCFS